MRCWVFPRCRGLHWTCGLIDFEAKLILFADSMGAEDEAFCRRLWCLLEAASLAMRGRSWDFTGWKWGSLGKLSPLQQNEHDCGIFPIMLARSIARRVKLRSGPMWGDRELDRYRDIIVLELLTGKIIT